MRLYFRFSELRICLFKNLHRSTIGRNVSFHIFGEFDLGIIFWRVTDHLAGIGNAPECARVVGYAVENLERDAVFVADIRTFISMSARTIRQISCPSWIGVDLMRR